MAAIARSFEADYRPCSTLRRLTAHRGRPLSNSGRRSRALPKQPAAAAARVSFQAALDLLFLRRFALVFISRPLALGRFFFSAVGFFFRSARRAIIIFALFGGFIKSYFRFCRLGRASSLISLSAKR